MSIAIVGVSFNLPDATDFDMLSKIILDGIDVSKDCTTSAEQNRILKFYELQGIKEFDPEFFGYSDLEIINMDPQHRQLLYLTWKALDEYGFIGDNQEEIKGFGVFTAVSQSDYFIKNILLNKKKVTYSTYINNIPDTAATKIAYKFDLRGESINITTACSSGLVALKKAFDALVNNQISGAIVGGSKIITDSESGYEYIEGSIFSVTGKCSPFDIESNGIIPGNGSVVLILKRLEDAIDNRDKILGVIHNIHSNNDGNLKVSFTAPSIQGQQNVIKGAYEKSLKSISDIDFIETHGTGTAIGDAIEIRSLFNAFKEANKEIYIGSVKANFGHLDTASGLLGILKALVIIQHQTIPRQANFSITNPLLDIEKTNLRVSKNSFKSQVRNVGVNSFGVGGTNVHAILGKYEYSNELRLESITNDKFIFPISYRADENYVSKILSSLPKLGEDERISAIRMLLFEKVIHSNIKWFSYTLKTGVIEEISEECIKCINIESIREDSAILKCVEKIHIPCEELKVKELWYDIRSSDIRNDALSEDIYSLIGQYVNKTAEQVGEMYLTDINIDSFLMIELISSLKKNYNINVDISDFTRKIKVSELLHLDNECLEEEKNKYMEYKQIDLEVKTILNSEIEKEKKEFKIAIFFRDFEKNTGISISPSDYMISGLSLSDYLQQRSNAILSSKEKNFIYLTPYDELKENLFVIHPAGGTVYGYKKIFLEKFYRYNIILIMFPFDKYNELKYYSLSSLASYYLEMIRMVNGNKKYNLCGYSFGGNVGYEICRQLTEGKSIVNTLIMIDSYPMEAYYTESVNTISEQAVNIMIKELDFNNLLEFEGIESLENVWKLNHMMLKQHYEDSVISIDNTCLLVCREKENINILNSLHIKDVDKSTWKKKLKSSLDIFMIQGNHYSIFSNNKHASDLGITVNQYLREHL
ncbi:beta-ketoacyl synthase N-terminal-like domain-containing protein [Clostridium gasigenes]|uniref:beta-ketoacyl synthase N-terminal-like domain-containing protein n=1 Tax=Clostridium gasigenes TaxID=94869 RepID=UPI001C0AA44C|nr:beta-ketoacyl synthase N-terminal-like domain-containing protein [Clostridium gasigenes]MBU3109294.1 hypothetical protein [Clostridium gasigenes]